MSKFVRLRPYNRRRGFVLRRYTYQSQKFLEGRWYEVPDVMGDHLETVTSVTDDDDSPLAFDVFGTKKEALAYVEHERVAKAKATAENPEQVGVLTTKDLDGEDARARREERAKANLERAKTKRAAEAEKEARRAVTAAKKEADKVKGGDGPGDATEVVSKPEDDPESKSEDDPVDPYA